MPNKFKLLPESEFEIMTEIWANGGAATSGHLTESLKRGWKQTTVLSLLSRLCERGFLKCERQGRHNLYTAIVSEDEYLREESAGFLNRVCRGSVARLVASLYDGRAISDSDLDELEAFIREARE